MVNYANDTELEEDYEIGWNWLEVDTGPVIQPYTGFRQCLLDPMRNEPEHFFEALFDSHMYTIMAEHTNLYAQRRIQGKYLFTHYLFHIRTKIKDAVTHKEYKTEHYKCKQ